ncbi:MAG: M66 family metalloprotease [Nannocystaceae bacterium]
MLQPGRATRRAAPILCFLLGGLHLACAESTPDAAAGDALGTDTDPDPAKGAATEDTAVPGEDDKDTAAPGGPTDDQDTGGETDGDDSDDSGDAGSSAEGSTGDLGCEDELVKALDWFPTSELRDLPGRVEYAQTHVVSAAETRHAPKPANDRATLFLFTPDQPIAGAEATDVRVAAFEGGTKLGVMLAEAPSALPKALESGITSAQLAPYSTQAWSAALPWEWVHSGVTLHIGYAADGALYRHEAQLEGLAAPHDFTVSRTKIVLFGDDTFHTDPSTIAPRARDFFGSVPAAELRWVDSSDWVLERAVVRTKTGPQMVASEAERRVVTSQSNHWSILKQQLSLRLSAANTGRGLSITDGGGDGSPYSFGTSVGLGWYLAPDGRYQDIADAGVAAGWTGWASVWLGNCGNGFIHELGHSFSLGHFTGGKATAWGIEDEYPKDGVGLETHPWGYDTIRHQFRTWYKVDKAGPVVDANGDFVGKRDPMNGGDSPNQRSCFPQYTGYHAQKSQNWMQNTPTITEVDEIPGIYLWEASEGRYLAAEAAPQFQHPVAVHTAVVTLIGTLANNDSASQTYPPIFATSGNVFDLPDPSDPMLHDSFHAAVWFLDIHYGDGTNERALIGHGLVPADEGGIPSYSLNLARERNPVRVDLYRSPTAYPNINVAEAELIHSRDIEAPSAPLRPVLRAGRGWLANDAMIVRERCETGVNCNRRATTSTWRIQSATLHFDDPDGNFAETIQCADPESYSVLKVPVVDSKGDAAMLVVHAQRVVEADGDRRAVALNDVTPWFDRPTLRQSLRLWAPWEANSSLAPGRYRAETHYVVSGYVDASVFSQTQISVDMEVLDSTSVDLASEHKSEGLTSADSSMYFLVRDARVGPTSKVWWGDAGPTKLRVPVVDDATGELAILVLDAWQEACDARWQIQAARGAGDCTHHIVLKVTDDDDENAGLQGGHTYRTAASAPLIVDAHRWHDPDAGRRIRTFAFALEYTAG